MHGYQTKYVACEKKINVDMTQSPHSVFIVVVELPTGNNPHYHKHHHHIDAVWETYSHVDRWQTEKVYQLTIR